MKLYYFQLERETSSFDSMAQLETKVLSYLEKKGNFKKLALKPQKT